MGEPKGVGRRVGGDLVSYLTLPSWCPTVLLRPQWGEARWRDLNEEVLCWEWRPAEIRHRVFCFNVRNLERNFTGLLGDQASNMTAKLPLKCCFPNNVIFIAWCSFCICCFIKIPLG